MLEKIGFKHKNKKINLECYRCNFIERIIGLMFSQKESANILLFDFNKLTGISIHSFFVFFPFLAVWLDSEGKIIEKRVINPWNPFVLPKKKFVKLIEIPINKKNSRVIHLLDDNTKHL